VIWAGRDRFGSTTVLKGTSYYFKWKLHGAISAEDLVSKIVKFN
jgi:hypothetical protein